MSEDQITRDDRKSKPWNFLFTRHALSCNNTDQGKYFGKIMNHLLQHWVLISWLIMMVE